MRGEANKERLFDQICLRRYRQALRELREPGTCPNCWMADAHCFCRDLPGLRDRLKSEGTSFFPPHVNENDTHIQTQMLLGSEMP